MLFATLVSGDVLIYLSAVFLVSPNFVSPQVGLNVERVSKGKYAEITATDRRPTPEEDVYISTEAMQVRLQYRTMRASLRSLLSRRYH